jgi:hypothetical protein
MSGGMLFSRFGAILPVRPSPRKPTTQYSGLAFDTPVVQVSATNIFLTFRTTLPGKREAQCPAADLGRIADGEYAVLYRSPDGKREPLGNIHIP